MLLGFENCGIIFTQLCDLLQLFCSEMVQSPSLIIYKIVDEGQGGTSFSYFLIEQSDTDNEVGHFDKLSDFNRPIEVDKWP